jgi:hypothetical protein
MSKPKSEGRNPKAERRPKPEVRKTPQRVELTVAKSLDLLDSSIRISDLGLLSGFGLRVSDFLPPSPSS